MQIQKNPDTGSGMELQELVSMEALLLRLAPVATFIMIAPGTPSMVSWPKMDVNNMGLRNIIQFAYLHEVMPK